jgi:hypothetical protein
MARKPLRSQLNQIRSWVRQGRTDAWIAHQLDVSTAELREFRRRHELSADDEGDAEVDLRDEIEAEIEATMAEEEEEPEDEVEEEPEDEEEAEGEPEASDEAEDDEEAAEGTGRRRRRRRRGGRGRSRRGRAALQAAFDHGERDGYGLWLDPAIVEDPIYAEHWAGRREVEVSIEPDQIVIKRADTAAD